MKYLILAIAFIGFFIFIPIVQADIFFIDADCGTPGDGSVAACTGAGTDSFNDTLDFTETGRNAGDIGIHRRGTTALYDDGTDLAFSSSGTLVNPIFLEADYEDHWGDFASSTQTATLTFGSKAVTMSASTTGTVAGDWIYVEDDDQREFAYEIESISPSTQLNLFLPYKGGQAGSGKTLNLMPNAPIWGTPATAIQWNFNGQSYWKSQGIHARGTDANGVIEIDSAAGHIFKDMIIEGNGSGDFGIRATDDFPAVIVIKSRFFNYSSAMFQSSGGGALDVKIKDSLFDGNNVSINEGLNVSEWDLYFVEGTEFRNHASVITFLTSVQRHGYVSSRNSIFESTTVALNHESSSFSVSSFEDFDGVIGDNIILNGLATSNRDTITKSTTTPVRSGGGATSIEVTPTTDISTNWEFSRIRLFEYPIYTNTVSRDYQVFFKSGSSTPSFITSPTAGELWIECEYWGHASNNFRRLLKSTATMDFTTDTDFDQSLTITCNPSQTGILYLRGWYSKTKETGAINEFFVDPRPVITAT